MEENVSKENESFIRNLDIKEVGFIKSGYDQNIVTCLPLRSKIDLFEDKTLSLLKAAILRVIESQEFMRSRIVKKNDNEYFYERIDFSKYNFENIKFLRINEAQKSSIESKNLLSGFLLDHMAINEINPNKDDSILIWRMYFLELDRQEKLYHILAQFHHVMVQSAQMNMIVFKIIQILEMLIKNKPFEMKELKIFLGCEKLLNIREIYEMAPLLEPVKRPSFINPDQAKANALSKPIPTSIDSNAELICVDMNNTRFASIDLLFQSSRLNHTRKIIWSHEDGLLKKLMIRSKKEGVKVNSVLELIASLAFKKLYQTFGTSDKEFSNLVYRTVVSLRDRKRTGGSAIDEDTLGLVTGGLITRPDTLAIERIVKNEDKLNDLFWPLAKKLSDELQHRILHDSSRFYVRFKPAAKDEINFHFTTSNIGLYDEAQISGLSHFELLPGTLFCTSDKNINCRLFLIWFYGLSSGQRLGCGVYYNSHFVDESIMNRYVEFFKRFLNNLLKSETI